MELSYAEQLARLAPKPRQNTPLRRLRRELDLTQAEMAASMGMSRARYCELEAGRRISIKLAEKVAEATGQTVGEVIDDYRRMKKGQ